MRLSQLKLAVMACLSLLTPSTRLLGADDVPVAPNYLVYPVRTELQKELVPRQANFFVLADMTNALKESSVIASALKLQELQNELRRHKPTAAKLHFTIFCKRTDADQTQQRAVVRYALMGVGHDLGFAKVTAHDLYPNTDMTWIELMDGFTGKRFQSEADEPAIKNEVAKAFTVRTPLSRFLTSGADCAIVILPSLKDGRGIIPQGVMDGATAALDKVKLEQRDRIHFYVEHIDQENKELLIANLRRLGEALGFRGTWVTFR